MLSGPRGDAWATCDVVERNTAGTADRGVQQRDPGSVALAPAYRFPPRVERGEQAAAVDALRSLGSALALDVNFGVATDGAGHGSLLPEWGACG